MSIFGFVKGRNGLYRVTEVTLYKATDISGDSHLFDQVLKNELVVGLDRLDQEVRRSPTSFGDP